MNDRRTRDRVRRKMADNWRALVIEKRQRQKASTPEDWVIPLPAETILDVTKIPEECGLLSPKEIEITSSPVELLLGNLASAKWSAIDVTIAFSKRAIIAHQLVRNALSPRVD